MSVVRSALAVLGVLMILGCWVPAVLASSVLVTFTGPACVLAAGTALLVFAWDEGDCYEG